MLKEFLHAALWPDNKLITCSPRAQGEGPSSTLYKGHAAGSLKWQTLEMRQRNERLAEGNRIVPRSSRSCLGSVVGMGVEGGGEEGGREE